MKHLKHVQFQIYADDIYLWGKGWVVPEEAREEWEKLGEELLERIGFMSLPKDMRIASSDRCPQGFNGAEGIYIHPMEITGIMSEETVAKIKKVLLEPKWFRFFTTKNVYSRDLIVADNTIGDYRCVEGNLTKSLEIWKRHMEANKLKAIRK